MFVLRFYAARRIAALAAAIVLTSVVTVISGWRPPADWGAFPDAARRAVGGLAGGLHDGVKVYWALMAVGFLVRDRRANLAWGSRGILALATIWWGLPAVCSLIAGLYYLANSGSHAGRSIGLVTRIAVIPIVIGATPFLCLEAMEKLKANPDWRRWFHDGQGPNADLAGPEKIRSVSRPMLKAPTPEGGHRVPGVIVGKALAEDVGDNDCMLVQEGSEHLVWIGEPGSGKHICAKPTYCTYPGSMSLVSNKSEQVDELLGARVDLSRMPPHTEGKAGRHGVNPRGITQAIYHLRNGRAFVLDYGGQSVYPGNRHTLLSEVDVNSDHGRLYALAIADGWFPDLPNCSSDPWYREAPKNALAATICHELSVETDPRKHTVPYCVQVLLGIDPFDPASGPNSFAKLLKAMVKNRHPKVGAFVATTAAQIAGLGDRSLGSLRSSLQTNCASALDAQFSKMLTGVSDFSYIEVGNDDPVSVFHVLPRGDASPNQHGLWNTMPLNGSPSRNRHRRSTSRSTTRRAARWRAAIGTRTPRPGRL